MKKLIDPKEALSVGTRLGLADKAASNYRKFLKGEISYSEFITAATEKIEHPEEQQGMIWWLESQRKSDHSNVTGSGSVFQALIDFDNIVTPYEDEYSEETIEAAQVAHKIIFKDHLIFGA